MSWKAPFRYELDDEHGGFRAQTSLRKFGLLRGTAEYLALATFVMVGSVALGHSRGTEFIAFVLLILLIGAAVAFETVWRAAEKVEIGSDFVRGEREGSAKLRNTSRRWEVPVTEVVAVLYETQDLARPGIFLSRRDRDDSVPLFTLKTCVEDRSQLARRLADELGVECIELKRGVPV